MPLGSSTKIPLQNIITHVKEKANRQLFGFRSSVRIVEDASLAYDDMVDISEKIFSWTQELDLPNITLFNIPSNEKNHSSSNGWFTRSTSFSRLFIRIGQVVYEYKDSSKLSTLLSRVTSYINNPNHFIATINIPVGLLDIPMSREEINSTEDNFKTVEKYFQEALNQLKKHYDSIVFDTNCGATEFHRRLNSFTNNSTIQYNIKADCASLEKHDEKLIKNLEEFFNEQNPIYKTGQISKAIDLHSPLPSYLTTLSSVSLSSTKFYSFYASTDNVQSDVNKSYFNFKLEQDKKYLIVLMPSKALYGTKQTDIPSYVRSLYTTTNLVDNTTTLDTFDLVRIIRTNDTNASFSKFKLFLETVAKDLNDVFFKNAKGKITLLSEFDIEDFKNFVKKNRVITNGTIVKNEYISGIRTIDLKLNCSDVKKFLDSHPTTPYTYYTSLFKSNDFAYRFEKRIDANSKTLPFSPVYLDTTKFDTVLLTKDETIPIINKNPYLNFLRVFELEADLKKACVIKVPEKQYEGVKKLFEKDATNLGYKLYTNEKPFNLVIPSIEELYLKNPDNSDYLKSIAMLLKPEIYKNYNYGFWRADLAGIKISLEKTLNEVIDTYDDKTNIYYLAVKEFKQFILNPKDKYIVNHHYNEAELKAFVQLINEHVLNSVLKNKETFQLNIDSILTKSIYSPEIIAVIFEKFGWNISNLFKN